ncbi:HTH-type transcriptional regulator ArgP [Paraburkholderia bonniea]|uniref:HTH-type transcriptional regulator ArgP n=1 Tax=Paraburkholderia bonniea TaxID=2152891 RepID=UPI0012920EE5|nr:HTH-type transcriptional regulator ArgP [Paraburkholderia bonniea]WJF89391.1 HTH-type transcriptional regulator ArgP [Paraburkholderia bonniea]WJF92706.1 HTH-type transcriptional regulator ArgP [Paraburkholderia bonniea]
MELDPRQTAAVRAVIETGSFEQAAVRLNLTASAVSQRVRGLEIRLGNPLIVRTRPCRATPVGQRLLQYLRRTALLEDDFASDLAHASEALLSIAVAVNADTLSTWFFPALADVLLQENVLLDLSVEDQDHTHARLASGLAIGCITTESTPLRGCSAEHLGAMRYRLVASNGFIARWFPEGLTRDAARRAPVMLSSRKDALQARFLETHMGLPPEAYPSHYVPAAVPRYLAIQRGLAYGMVPELEFGADLAQGLLQDLAPALPTDVELYWHTWKVQSPRLEKLSAQIVARGRAALAQGPAVTGLAPA